MSEFSSSVLLQAAFALGQGGGGIFAIRRSALDNLANLLAPLFDDVGEDAWQNVRRPVLDKIRIIGHRAAHQAASRGSSLIDADTLLEAVCFVCDETIKKEDYATPICAWVLNRLRPE